MNSSSLPESSKPSRRFEILEHTADIGLRAFGANPAEVFQAAAAGLFAVLLDSGDNAPSSLREIRLAAANYAELLCDFLNELLYLFDVEKVIPCSVLVETLDPSELRARVALTRFDPMRHAIRTYVKAVTYHQLKFESNDAGAVADFYLDV